MELLANTMRPTKLSDVVGQDNLVGKNGILTNLIKNNKMYSIILYGHPGTGKTSIANAIVNELDKKYRFLNATINNKNDFEVAIETAKMYGEMVLVVDEIHRMNKDKQDILLPYIESGLIILIGLTTSNPYHSINPAIRSRVEIFELNDLTEEDIKKSLKRIVKELDGISLKKEVIDYIVKVTGSDLRSAITLLEIAYNSSKDHVVTLEMVQKINSKPIYFHDKNESDYYDLLSAFQKSIRGSDVDASLHYLARLVNFGDLESVFRRMSVIAYEDIGLANPGIGPKVMAAIDAARLVGMPEAMIPLGLIITEMALSPKSNSACTAIHAACEDVLKGNIGAIPDNIKISSHTYKYPHDYKNAYVKQNYMPDKLKDKKYYIPKNNKYENNLNKIRKEMEE